MKEINVILKK